MKTEQEQALETIQEFLRRIDFPLRRITRQTATCLYALLDKEARGGLLADKGSLSEGARIHDIIEFARGNLGTVVAENTRESYRKLSLKPLLDAGYIVRVRASVNDPKTHYYLNKTFEGLLRSFLNAGTDAEKQGVVRKWEAEVGRLRKASRAPEPGAVTIEIDGEEKTLSPGNHNILIKQIVEVFAPIFIESPKVLYLGDTEHKMKHVDPAARNLGLKLDQHEKLPDVILYSTTRNIVFIVEAVTSAGPIDEARIADIKKIIFPRPISFGVDYFTVFPDRRTFRKFVEDIGWGTQVWLAAEAFGVIIFRRV